MKSFSKKDLIKTIGGVALASALIFSSTTTALAHGWIVNDRAHLSSANGGNRNTHMGRVRFEPQSAGEVGGRFRVENGNMSLNAAVTAGGFPEMGHYGVDRFARTALTGGPTDMRWWFTQPHRTTSIVWYVSRPGTDLNRPLNFADFEYIQTFNYNGNSPSASNRIHTHRVNLPTGRRGPAVIMAAWHISDNNVSWYRVKDVYFTPDGVVTPGALNPAPFTPQWNPNSVYIANDRVIYNGQIWRAGWWTQRERPGTSAVWTVVGPAPAPTTPPVTPPTNPPAPTAPPVTPPTNPPTTTTPTNPPAGGGATTPTNGPRIWEASISFAAGDRAIHNNLQWHARVASQGVTPGTNNAVWQMMGAAPAMPVNPPANNNNAPSNTDVPTWTNAASFNAGDIVRHNNLRWRAETNTQGVTPGTNNAVWRMLGR